MDESQVISIMDLRDLIRENMYKAIRCSNDPDLDHMIAMSASLYCNDLCHVAKELKCLELFRRKFMWSKSKIVQFIDVDFDNRYQELQERTYEMELKVILNQY